MVKNCDLDHSFSPYGPPQPANNIYFRTLWNQNFPSNHLQTVLLEIPHLRNSKWSRITADLNILKAPRMESQTIRIKTITTVSCSVRFKVFSCDSCFAGKNSGLFQIEIKVSSRFHRVCLLDSTIATCFRRIQAKFD